jgi:PadR family transcriptional regulator, regulatory protein AphA
MNVQTAVRGNRTYIACLPGDGHVASEREAMELIEACINYETPRILLTAENLDDEFYNLKSGVAGEVLQKFALYRLRVAAVLTPELVGNGRFAEMVSETNHGSLFRVFYDRERAETWLLAE